MTIDVGGGNRAHEPNIVSGPRVFVSYAQRPEIHKRQVQAFCWFLRAMGVKVRQDEFATDERRDWALWAIREIAAADFVVVVASAEYRRRAESECPPGDGDGVANEAAFLRDRLAYDRWTWHRKILPVVLPGGSLDQIPLFLSPYSASRYEVTSLTPGGAAPLLATLHRPALGPRPCGCG